MAVLRLDETLWERVRNHIAVPGEERFAFFLCSASDSLYGPVFVASDVVLVPGSEVTRGDRGWELSTAAIVEVVNRAISGGHALVEAHYHGGSKPRFSDTDLIGLDEFVPYALDSLPRRAYAATVWGEKTVSGTAFRAEGDQSSLESVTVSGNRFVQLASQPDEPSDQSSLFSRQTPWFSQSGQKRLATTRFGVVGASGTGSQVITQLGGLGARRFVVVDPDTLGEENLNRIPYARATDIGQSKATLAGRYLEQIAPDAEVHALAHALQSNEALHALKGVDVLVGCVDNDGARLILNEIALAYGIPYFDVGVGIQVGPSGVEEIGATLAVVIPGGPCLNCMGLIDPIEARYFVTSPESREVERTWGYVDGLEAPAPAVCSLNAAAAAMLVNDFALFATGARRPSPLTQLDVLGRAYELQSQRVVPIQVSADFNCFECQKALAADDSGVERCVWRSVSPAAEKPSLTLAQRFLSRLRSMRTS